MKFYLKIFLFISFLQFHFIGKAQNPLIVKDPSSCLYGLKDKNGKWILQPHYTQIENFSYNGKAKVLLNNKNGIIDKNGKEIIAPIYDKIIAPQFGGRNLGLNTNPKEEQDVTTFIVNCFIVYQNGKCGMIDSTGKIILEPLYNSIAPFINGITLVETTTRQKCFADRTGITFCIPEDMVIDEMFKSVVGINRYRVRMLVKKENGQQKYGWGVMDKTGRMILPCAFDSISVNAIRLDILGAYQKDKEGFYSMEGEKITEHIYTPFSSELRVWNYIIQPYLILSTNNHWGVMIAKGKFSIDCIYDTLMEYQIGIDSVDLVGVKNNQWNLLNTSGDTLIKTGYDQLRISPKGQVGGYESGYLLAKKDGKWGAVNLQGFEIMKTEFDTVFMDQYYDIFWSPQQARVFFQTVQSGFVSIRGYRPQPEERVSYLSDVYWRKDDYERWGANTVQFENYYETADTNYQYGKYLGTKNILEEVNLSQTTSADSVFFLFHLPHDIGWWYESNADPYDADVGYYYAVRNFKNGKPSISYAWSALIDSSHVYFTIGSKSNMVIRDDGKVILDSVSGMSFYGFGFAKDSVPLFCFSHFSTNKAGIMDANGKIITQEEWFEIRPLKGDTIWVSTSNDYESCSGKWNMLDISTGKLLLKPDEQLFNIVEATEQPYLPEATEKGFGLFDAKQMRFIISPSYRYIFPLDRKANYYSVVTFSGKTGIIDRNNKLVADTVWQKIIALGNYSYYYYESDTNYSPFRYVLIGKNQQAIFDNSGMHPFNNAYRDSVFKSTAFIWTTGNSYYYWSRKGEVRIAVDSGTVFQSWQINLLTDSVFLSPFVMDYRNEFRINYNVYSDEVNVNGCDSWYRHTPDYFNYRYSDISREIGMANSNCLSFRRCIMNNSNSYYDRRQRDYYNYMLFNGKPEIVTLSSLFSGDEWKNLITNSILSYLELHPEIDAPCADANLYPRMLENSFLIDSTGLILLPDWEIRNREKTEIQVLIPWEKVKPYLKKEIAAKLDLK